MDGCIYEVLVRMRVFFNGLHFAKSVFVCFWGCKCDDDDDDDDDDEQDDSGWNAEVYT